MAINNLILPKIESTAMSAKFGQFVIGQGARGHGVDRAVVALALVGPQLENEGLPGPGRGVDHHVPSFPKSCNRLLLPKIRNYELMQRRESFEVLGDVCHVSTIVKPRQTKIRNSASSVNIFRWAAGQPRSSFPRPLWASCGPPSSTCPVRMIRATARCAPWSAAQTRCHRVFSCPLQPRAPRNRAGSARNGRRLPFALALQPMASAFAAQTDVAEKKPGLPNQHLRYVRIGQFHLEPFGPLGPFGPFQRGPIRLGTRNGEGGKRRLTVQ